jgi:hypothetical protein
MTKPAAKFHPEEHPARACMFALGGREAENVLAGLYDHHSDPEPPGRWELQGSEDDGTDDVANFFRYADLLDGGRARPEALKRLAKRTVDVLLKNPGHLWVWETEQWVQSFPRW